MKQFLEMLVQDVQTSVGETPEKEQTGYQNERDQKSLEYESVFIFTCCQVACHTDIVLRIQYCQYLRLYQKISAINQYLIVSQRFTEEHREPQRIKKYFSSA
jgi:hypothetical protein